MGLKGSAHTLKGWILLRFHHFPGRAKTGFVVTGGLKILPTFRFKHLSVINSDAKSLRMIRFLVVLLLAAMSVRGQNLPYYLPDSVTYNRAIPEPEKVIGHKVGEWHVMHDRLVNYMKELARSAPERIKLQYTGFTYEARPQLILIITSPENHKNLEQIRQAHLQLSDPLRSASLDITRMPAVVLMGYSIHGNESSGSNAALLAAYHLAAAEGKEIDDLLSNTVILLDPSFNPDGLNRFATWANMHKSKRLVTDPNSREFHEAWPGGRFNHYWFDLNRDWLPAVHPESQNRLRIFHQWKPNVLTDHHEMGSNSTFFFQPGVPSRVNPLTPAKNQELTGKIGSFHANYLNRIGSLYFTKEGYDDFYYGKGSTYPDVNGAVGILFEQASSRGHAQETVNGILSFPFTIRNQFITTLSTLEAVRNLRIELLNYQREFYRDAIKESATYPVKAFVYGDPENKTKTALFTEMLLRHQIEVYRTGTNVNAGNGSFEKDHSYIVPLGQPQQRLIRTIFEQVKDFQDSLFYDITSWTMPAGYGITHAELRGNLFKTSMLGAKLDSVRLPQGGVSGNAGSYAFVFEWNELFAPRFLYEIQEAGIKTRVATRPFTTMVEGKPKTFDYGTIIVQRQLHTANPDSVYGLLHKLAIKNGITVYGLSTGLAESGIDLGSNKMAEPPKPSVLMLTGTGVSATDAGEIWHLFDQRFEIPLSTVDIPVFNRIDLARYNTLIMVSGNYSELNKDKLRTWVQGGGNLILLEDAINWASREGLISVSLRKARSGDTASVLAYAEREFRQGSARMSGAIFRADLDRSHPLAYGYKKNYADMFKNNAVFLNRNRNPYSNPFVYGKEPLYSGYITRANYEEIKNSAAVLVNTLGSGRVISIADNPVFRGWWLGGNKLLMNAVFFGKLIDAGSAISE